MRANEHSGTAPLRFGWSAAYNRDGSGEMLEVEDVLRLDAATVRGAARRRASAASIVRVFVRQACHEARLRSWRHIRFRSRRNDEACQAYAAMQPWEFEGINARQAWANWRTIPRNLDCRAPARPVRALDLCCGTGQSTEVLSYYLAPGSQILGLEWSERFVDVARRRCYTHRNGTRADVGFRAQSVLEAFRDAAGELLPRGSVDLVNCCGAVGCHFDRRATARLAREVGHVLRAGGLALIDAGPGGTGEVELRAIFEPRGFEVVHRARSCALDRYVQLCFVKRGRRTKRREQAPARGLPRLVRRLHEAWNGGGAWRENEG